jgi:hypothetical protein
MLSRWNQHSVYWNGQASPNGGFIFSQVRWLDGIRHEDIISRIPPYPSVDTIARNSFVPVEVSARPLSEAGIANAVVEFGYSDDGDPGNLFCTSRQETCVATESTVNTANPFFYAESESYTGADCAFGCSITIPALSQRVLYYRWKYRDAGGQVIGVSDTNVIAVP